MFLLKVLRGMALLAAMACYLAIACIVVYFPLIHAAEAVIYPFWRWSHLVNHMAIKDSLPYFFLLAIVCTFAQAFGSFFSRRISRKARAVAETN